MIVRFGPWDKENVISLYIIITFIWLLGITILFPFFQNSNLIEIFNTSPQLYVGCFFTPRFNCNLSGSQTGDYTKSFSALKPSSSTTW